MKLSQAIVDFSTWRTFSVSGHTVVRYDSALKIFCLATGDPDVELINLDHIMSYLKHMEKLGYMRNSINIVCLAFRALFGFLEIKGVKCMPAELIPIPKREYNIPRVAEDKDFRKLVAAIPKVKNGGKYNMLRNTALIHMVWDTGARQGEILSLDVDDIKFEKDGSGYAVIKTEKSRGRRPIREIFWTAKTTQHLKRWLTARKKLMEMFKFQDDEALFVSIMKANIYDSRGKRMTNRGVCEVFRTLSNRAGLPSIFNAHSARHRMGRKIIKNGGSSADVTNLLGHSQPESSYIYTMMWGKDLKKRYNYFKTKS